MNFLPLMLMMNGMGGAQNDMDIDGLMGSLGKMKKFRDIGEKGMSMELAAELLGEGNPEMAGAINMMKMMNGMSAMGGGAFAGGASEDAAEAEPRGGEQPPTERQFTGDGETARETESNAFEFENRTVSYFGERSINI